MAGKPTPEQRREALERAVALQESHIRTPHIRTDASNKHDDQLLETLRTMLEEANGR